MSGDIKFLSADYWTKRYQDQNTGWDIGYESTPLKEYFDQLEGTDKKILIPGCGNCYEGIYLWHKGFRNLYMLDLSPLPLEVIEKTIPEIPDENLICGNFFDLTDSYDLIIEQTFFCAIDPEQRERYAKKVYSLLNPGGKLVGVMFNKEVEGGPPFGGSISEYQKLFNRYFDVVKITECYNSIERRQGSEVFVILEKR